MNTITAHIEGTKSKGFAIYANAFDSVIATDGATVAEAQASFREAIETTALSYEETGDNDMAQSLREAEVEYIYDVSALFSLFKDIKRISVYQAHKHLQRDITAVESGAKSPQAPPTRGRECHTPASRRTPSCTTTIMSVLALL